MQFTTITAAMAFCATFAMAVPTEKRGAPSKPTKDGVCSSGDNYCKGSSGWKKGSSCDTGDVYCCAAVGLIPALNCINIENISVTIPIDLDILKA